MHIEDSKDLTKAINALNHQRIAQENQLLDNLAVVKGYFDPAYQINRLLPRKVPVGKTINNILDESLMNAAYDVTDKLIPASPNSMVKTMGHNFFQKLLSSAVDKNGFKIKAIGLAIIKNIFK